MMRGCNEHEKDQAQYASCDWWVEIKRQYQRYFVVVILHLNVSRLSFCSSCCDYVLP